MINVPVCTEFEPQLGWEGKTNTPSASCRGCVCRVVGLEDEGVRSGSSGMSGYCGQPENAVNQAGLFSVPD